MRILIFFLFLATFSCGDFAEQYNPQDYRKKLQKEQKQANQNLPALTKNGEIPKKII